MWWERPNICKLRLDCRPLKEVFSQCKSVLHPNLAELSFARCMGCRLPCLDFAWEKSILCTIRWFRSSISRWPRDCEIAWDCERLVYAQSQIRRCKVVQVHFFLCLLLSLQRVPAVPGQARAEVSGYGEYTAIWKGSLTICLSCLWNCWQRNPEQQQEQSPTLY